MYEAVFKSAKMLTLSSVQSPSVFSLHPCQASAFVLRCHHRYMKQSAHDLPDWAVFVSLHRSSLHNTGTCKLLG